MFLSLTQSSLPSDREASVNAVIDQIQPVAFTDAVWSDDILRPLQSGADGLADIQLDTSQVSIQFGVVGQTIRDVIAGVQEALGQGLSLLGSYDFSRLPGLRVAPVDESYLGATQNISLKHFGSDQHSLSWNTLMTTFALDSLGLSASGREGKLVSSVDESGRVLLLADQDGLAVLRLTLVEPGQNGNGTNTWSVAYEQLHGLAQPAGLLPNDLLMLPLFVNTTASNGKVSPNLLALAIGDDSPQIQFSSNFLIFDLLINNLLDAGAEITGGSLLDLVHKLTVNDNHELGFELGEMLQDIVEAATGFLGKSLSFDGLEALLDLVSPLVNKDLGADLKALINSPVVSLVLGGQKDALLETVDRFLNLTDSRRAVEGDGPATGVLNVDFGFDGAATEHTRPVGWKLLHGDDVPSATGWSVAGVQAIFDVMKIRAAGHEGTRLKVMASPDENVFPPQTLLIRAGDVDVMTLRMTSDGETYGYAIEQHTGLGHEQGTLLGMLVGMFQDLVGKTIDNTVEGLIDGVFGLLTSGLGPVLQDLLGGAINDIKALLLEPLSVENFFNTFSVDNLLYLPLPYITMDGDGDMAVNLLFHAIKDSTPGIIGQPEDLLVSESDLAIGAFPGSDAGHARDDIGRGGSDEAQASGQFTLQAFDGVGTVTVNGVTLWQDGKSTGTATGRFGELIVTDITDDGDGNYTVHYQYHLTSAAEHVAPGQGADANRTQANVDEAERFVFIVADGDGDTTESAAFSVTIQDGTPYPEAVTQRHELADGETYHDGWSMEGVLSLNYGADGPSQTAAAFTVALRLPDQAPQYLTADDDGQIRIEGLYGDLFINAETGQFSYVISQARIEAAEPPKGHFETQVLPFTHDFRTPSTDPSVFTGTLFSRVTGFKGADWSDDNARAGLNSSALESWLASSAATVSKDGSGFGVAGNAAGILLGDGDKLGTALQGLFTRITETVVMTLKESVHEISINFGDITIGETGTVFFYGVDGEYLGSKSFGGLNIFASDYRSVHVAENEFTEAIGSFLVAPGNGSFTIESISVPTPQQVWVENPNETLTFKDDFSYLLTDADGDQVEGFLSFDLGDEPVFGSIGGEVQSLMMSADGGNAFLGVEQDGLIVGGQGDDIVHLGSGHNQVWGNGGADVIAWSDVLFTAGSDRVMDFDLSEGDRLDYSALDRAAVQDLSLDGDVLSFTLESGSAERTVDVHLKTGPALDVITAEYVGLDNPAQQQDLLTSLMKDISVV